MSETILETLDNSPKNALLRNPLNPPIVYLANRLGGERPKELERFLKFAVVGISGAIVDFSILIGLQATILPPIRPLNVAIATAIAFFTAVISNFTWTRLWVYPESRSQSLRKQLAQFTIISLTGGVARTVWITASYSMIGYLIMPVLLPFLKLLKPDILSSTFLAQGLANSTALLETPNLISTNLLRESLGSIVAQLIGMGVVMMWNFFANRYWTYKDVK